MDLLQKLAQIPAVIGLIYLWNRYLVPTLMNRLIGFHKKHNAGNVHRQPIKFLIEKKSSIIRGLATLYWIGGGLIIYGILAHG